MHINQIQNLFPMSEKHQRPDHIHVVKAICSDLETMMTQVCGTIILISAKPSQSERVAEADRAESRLIVGLTYCGLNLKTDELLEIVPS